MWCQNLSYVEVPCKSIINRQLRKAYIYWEIVLELLFFVPSARLLFYLWNIFACFPFLWIQHYFFSVKHNSSAGGIYKYDVVLN